MDFFQKGDSGRDFDGHVMILSNFTHNGATVGRSLCQRRRTPLEQRLDGLFQKETGGFRLAKFYIIYRALIAQNAIPIHDEYMWSSDGLIQIGDDVLGISQDPGQASGAHSLNHTASGLVSI